jgi:hypothetical protein
MRPSKDQRSPDIADRDGMPGNHSSNPAAAVQTGNAVDVAAGNRARPMNEPVIAANARKTGAAAATRKRRKPFVL